jgi:predicted metal-dependent peptidase
VATADQRSKERLALKRKALEIWRGDRAALLMQAPFLALLAMQVELRAVCDSRLQTATCDRSRLFVDAELLLSLEPWERQYLLAHLLMHCALGHADLRGGLSKPAWDYAIDSEVNGLLATLDISLPDDVPQGRGELGDAAKRCLALMRSRRPLSRGRLADLHVEPQALLAAPADEHVEPDPDLQLRFEASDDVKWRERVIAAAQQVRQREGIPDGLAGFVEAHRKPRLSWSELLRQNVSSALGAQRRWVPPARRHLHRGLYLPSMRSQRLEVTVALDTSGSTQRAMDRFLAELSGIVAAFGRYQLTLLQADSQLQSIGVFDEAHPLDPEHIELCGLGGTDFRPVFEQLAGNWPALLVFLTDGLGPAPAEPPRYPVIWVLPPGGRAPASWGKVLRIPAERGK